MRTLRRKPLRCTAGPHFLGEVTSSKGPSAPGCCQARMSRHDECPSRGRGRGAGTAWSLWRTVRNRPLKITGRSPAGVLERQDVAALRAPALEHQAAVLGLHAAQEPVGLGAATIVGLKGTLHGSTSGVPSRGGGRTFNDISGVRLTQGHFHPPNPAPRMLDWVPPASMAWLERVWRPGRRRAQWPLPGEHDAFDRPRRPLGNHPPRAGQAASRSQLPRVDRPLCAPPVEGRNAVGAGPQRGRQAVDRAAATRGVQ